MSAAPDWLPPMVSVSPWTHDTFDILYSIFKRDFKDSRPMYEGRAVWFFPETEEGREVIFWHLTHREDKQTGQRLPDHRRCERLPWVRSIIENAHRTEVLAFDYQESDGSVKTYLWLRDSDFLVLMKKYPDGGRRLITSYYIDYPHKRRKLQRRYDRRLCGKQEGQR